MSDVGDLPAPRALTDIMSTPVYGERLTIAHLAAEEQSAAVAGAVARLQSSSGWQTFLSSDRELSARATSAVDVVVRWGAASRLGVADHAGRWPTVVVLGGTDAHAVLSRPTRWLAEFRRAGSTNLLVVPAEWAERYTRWGPPVPLALRPPDLPTERSVTLLSALIARAYAFGGR